MYRILLLLLFTSVSAYATTYNIVVTNDEHVEILEIIIEGINYFFGIDNAANDGAVRYYSMVKFVLVLGTLWALVQLAMSAMSGNSTAGFKHYFMYLFLVFTVAVLIYGPRSSVLIQTRDGSSYGTATDVPFVFAFTLSMFTTLQYELSDITESAFNVPDPTDNFSSGGAGGLGYYGGQINLSKAAQVMNFQAQNNNRELASKYSAYMKDCLILPTLAVPGGDTRMQDMLNQTDLKGNITPTATTFGTELVNYDGVTGTCDEFWNGGTATYGAGFVGLSTSIQNFENNVTANSTIGRVGSSLAYFGAVMNNNSAIQNAAGVKSAITQSVMSNEFRSVFSKMGVAGQVASDGAAQTMADMQITGISTGLFVAEQLPRAAFLLFALMVSATPFLLAFAMFPGSFQILLNYLKTLLWISLWQPMANILGVFQDYHFAKVLENNSYTTINDVVAMTPTNLIDISSEAAALAGIAGGLFVAIQGLSWMLITGSGQMIGNLMSSTSSSFQRHSNADAQLETRAEMQEAALMSKELGKSVGLREKFAYAASMQAAQRAGSMSGQMIAHGENSVGASHSMTHSEANSVAFRSGESISKASQMGGAVNAVELGSNSGDLSGASTKTEFGSNNTDYGKAGSIDGGRKLGVHEANIGEFKDSQNAQRVSRATTGFENKQSIANANQLEKNQASLDNLAEHQAYMKIAKAIDSEEQFRSEHNQENPDGKLSQQESFSKIGQNAATNDAAQFSNLDGRINGSDGASNLIHSQNSLGFDSGNLDKNKAQTIDQNKGTVDAKNRTAVERSLGADFAQVKEIGRITQRFNALHQKRARLEGELSTVQNSLNNDMKKINNGELLSPQEMENRDANIKQEQNLQGILASGAAEYNEAKREFDGVTNQDETIATTRNANVTKDQAKISSDDNFILHASEGGTLEQSKTAAHLDTLNDLSTDLDKLGGEQGTAGALSDVGEVQGREFNSEAKLNSFLQSFNDEDRPAALEFVQSFGYSDSPESSQAANAVAIDQASNSMDIITTANGVTRKSGLDVNAAVQTLRYDDSNSITTGTKTDIGNIAAQAGISASQELGHNPLQDGSKSQMQGIAVAGGVGNMAQGVVTGKVVRNITRGISRISRGVRSSSNGSGSKDELKQSEH